MKPFLVIGSVLLVAGLLSLFIPIPQHQRHGVEVGGVSLGVETVSHDKVPPLISAVLIAGGVALIAAGSLRARR